MTDITLLNPWDKIARRPRCPECSCQKVETVSPVKWLEIDYRCTGCGHEWTDKQGDD